MIRSLFSLAAIACLAACGAPGGVASAGSTPAVPVEQAGSPLASTKIEQNAFKLAIDAIAATSKVVDVLVSAGFIPQSTPLALRISGGIASADFWVGIARTAQADGDSGLFAAALAQAKDALAGVRTALK